MNLEEAREYWKQVKRGFVPSRPTRVAWLGDGRGFATSNMIYEPNPAYVYARTSASDPNHFIILNRNAVRPAFNMPVVIGYTQDEPNYEQVLNIHWGGLEHQGPASSIGGLGPHGIQHEFGGGDEVFIDSRLILPGLAQPTAPPSMQIMVYGFTYYHKGWQQFSQTTSIDLTTYLPTTNDRHLLITVDPIENVLRYRPGPEISAFAVAYSGGGGFASVPKPPADEIPICSIYLTSSTTEINWNAVTTNNLYDMRLFLSSPQDHLEGRIEALEGILGYSEQLPMMGANTRTVDEFPGTIDGGTY